MAVRPEIVRFLNTVDTYAADVLGELLEKELPESGRLMIVDCGKAPSLLHASSEVLTFCFIELKAQPQPATLVRTVRIPSPRDARITEERELLGDPLHGRFLRTTKLIAEHESFPATLELDCRKPDDETVVTTRALFHSWSQSAPTVAS